MIKTPAAACWAPGGTQELTSINPEVYLGLDTQWMVKEWLQCPCMFFLCLNGWIFPKMKPKDHLWPVFPFRLLQKWEVMQKLSTTTKIRHTIQLCRSGDLAIKTQHSTSQAQNDLVSSFSIPLKWMVSECFWSQNTTLRAWPMSN